MKFIAILFILVFPIAAVSQEQNLNFEEIIRVLEANQPKTVAQALHAIKAKHPKYFDNYALVARSMSIQGSTPANPRVVLFDQDAKLVISFNGEVGERGYDRIELMSFDDSMKSYDFREIKFFGDSNTAGTYEISESGGVGGRCLNCHGQNALPIWDSYPFWPDYYGSLPHNGLWDARILEGIQQGEIQRFTDYLATARSHERYSVLTELNFEAITEMNSKITRAFASRIKDVAKAELAQLPTLASTLKQIFTSFNPAETRAFGADEIAELDQLGKYQETKMVRYSRSYGIDKGVLLDLLVTSQSGNGDAARAYGVPVENRLQIWTLTNTQPADLILLPQLRKALADDVGYLNSISIVPGRRFIDFSHPDLKRNESGIENMLSDLL